MSPSAHTTGAHRVVVIGGGFGGIQAVKAMSRLDADITLIDRQNYHLFQPLSYQVATGALAGGDIAIPLRHIFKRQKRVRVLLGEVTDFDLEKRQVTLQQGPDRLTIPYDSLIVGAGSEYSYFGHEEWRSIALEVKSLDSAAEVRGRILHAFEVAELEPENRERWLTFVIVGAGPTGVEMAGQIAELAHGTLKGEFRQIDPASARVLLVEMGEKVLAAFPGRLPDRAQRSLERLGVTPMLGQRVVDVRADGVELEDRNGAKSRIATENVIWAAGVTASPLAKMLGDASGGDVDRSGRLAVEPDLSLGGRPEVFAIGDMVSVRDPNTNEPKVLPGLAPVAMQQGRYAAKVVAAVVKDRQRPAPFRYRDKGELATIGKARAVASVGPFRFSGVIAWLTWLVVHIYYLIGFENREVVLLRWGYNYLTSSRSSRLITAAARHPDLPGRP
jgi:NADH:ubiquinone reductase (H+-translocating)